MENKSILEAKISFEEEYSLIITLTANPSIDISYKLDELKIDGVNRTGDVSKTAGGKGLNVSRVLHQLGENVTATGFLGGNHGDFIKTLLDQDDMTHRFSEISGETRDSIAIIHEGKQTEVLEPGPTITPEEESEFIQLFKSLLTDDVSVVTMSGSLPVGLEKDFYSRLIQICVTNGKKVLLDTSGETLVKSVNAEHKPYLIKPNETEILALVDENSQVESLEDLKRITADSTFDGIEIIVVTLGKDGAFIKYQDRYYKADIPTIEVVNPVGSGDSTVAGFAYAIENNYDIEGIIKAGMTCGLLNTMHPLTGNIDATQYDTYYNQITIKEI